MVAPSLRVRDAGADRTVTVDQTPFTIGRRETNMLRLAATEVSREHAEIILEGESYRLRDRGSSRGTFVNEEAVTDCELRSGDRIRLGGAGGAHLQFLRHGEEPSLTFDPTTSPQQNLREVAKLLERLQDLGSERLLHDVLTLVLDTALDLSGAERGFVMRPSPQGTLEITLGRSHTRETLTDEDYQTSRTIPPEVFRTGETRVERDLSALEGDHDQTSDLGIRYVICLPLDAVSVIDAGTVLPGLSRIGVLYLDSRTSGRLLSADTRKTLEAVATEASLAIASASLYRDRIEKTRLEHDMQLAAKLQQELMPPPIARLRHVEAAAVCLPCRAVGGDFFDYVSDPAATFRFTLGDVAGKGPPAALLSAMMLGMFRLASHGPSAMQADSPEAIVTSINAAMCQRGIEARFVTLMYGVLRPDGRLTYCNAGHNPPLVVGEGGVRRLETGGPIVGVLPHASFLQETIELTRGDLVLLFSDGVTEAPDAAGEEFGDARLIETVQRVGTADAPALVDAVVDDVREFAPEATQGDDITVMAIRYLGASASP